MSNAFKVPSDLADKDLTIRQVREIIDNRIRRKILQARLDGLDDKAQGYKDEILSLEKREDEMLETQDT